MLGKEGYGENSVDIFFFFIQPEMFLPLEQLYQHCMTKSLPIILNTKINLMALFIGRRAPKPSKQIENLSQNTIGKNSSSILQNMHTFKNFKSNNLCILCIYKSNVYIFANLHMYIQGGITNNYKDLVKLYTKIRKYNT